VKHEREPPTEDVELVHEISATDPPEGFPVRLVAVDGHGGSGKSTLAARLARKLEAEIVHTDDFASWDHPLDWWPRLVEEVLEPIRLGATALSYARGRWSPDHDPPAVVDQPVTETMILEGVSAARKEFRPYLTYAVWVDTPRELCLQRGLERNGEELRDQWERWFVDEDAYVARDDPVSYVDRIVLGW